MSKTITITLEQYKRLCGCLLESQELLESLRVKEFKTPKLSKAEKRRLEVQRALREHKING